jgi:membrane-associated phospholipid phosphatase
VKRAVVLLATLAAPAVVFGALAEEVAEGASLSWDGATYRAIEGSVTTVGTPVGAHAVLVLAALGGVAALAAAAVHLLHRRRFRELAFLAIGIGGMLALDPILKGLFQRPPVTPDGSGYSFPSGTAMVSVAVAGAAAVLLERRLLRWSAVIGGGLACLGLGISVVYLRWHHASDVVAGWCMALAWLSTLWLVLLLPAGRTNGTGRSVAGPPAD